jgi:hypothetical protein
MRVAYEIAYKVMAWEFINGLQDYATQHLTMDTFVRLSWVLNNNYFSVSMDEGVKDGYFEVAYPMLGRKIIKARSPEEAYDQIVKAIDNFFFGEFRSLELVRDYSAD